MERIYVIFLALLSMDTLMHSPNIAALTSHAYTLYPGKTVIGFLVFRFYVLRRQLIMHIYVN